ncbi:MAG TPA: LPS export ABC transporter periplasmic protein LptC [Candidatus Baltobacteraceae bacterium]|nr:LPS export ABC transporter periplasmic protein LptC [Candidatus Baltobacteraceae bacterium]
MRASRPVLGVVLVLTAASGCAPRAPSAASAGASPTAGGSPGATPVPVHVRGVGTAQTPTVLSETIHGRRVYTIRAMLFEGDIVGSHEGTAVLQQPHVTFIDKSGAATVADAPKATVSQRDKSVLMTGGVRARTQEGSILTCDTLRYDTETERFDGEGHVVLRGANGAVLEGDHLDGDVRLHDVRVTSGAAA